MQTELGLDLRKFVLKDDDPHVPEYECQLAPMVCFTNFFCHLLNYCRTITQLNFVTRSLVLLRQNSLLSSSQVAHQIQSSEQKIVNECLILGNDGVSNELE